MGCKPSKSGSKDVVASFDDAAVCAPRCDAVLSVPPGTAALETPRVATVEQQVFATPASIAPHRFAAPPTTGRTEQSPSEVDGESPLPSARLPELWSEAERSLLEAAEQASTTVLGVPEPPDAVDACQLSLRWTVAPSARSEIIRGSPPETLADMEAAVPDKPVSLTTALGADGPHSYVGADGRHSYDAMGDTLTDASAVHVEQAATYARTEEIRMYAGSMEAAEVQEPDLAGKDALPSDEVSAEPVYIEVVPDQAPAQLTVDASATAVVGPAFAPEIAPAAVQPEVQPGLQLLRATVSGLTASPLGSNTDRAEDGVEDRAKDRAEDRPTASETLPALMIPQKPLQKPKRRSGTTPRETPREATAEDLLDRVPPVPIGQPLTERHDVASDRPDIAAPLTTCLANVEEMITMVGDRAGHGISSARLTQSPQDDQSVESRQKGRVETDEAKENANGWPSTNTDQSRDHDATSTRGYRQKQKPRRSASHKQAQPALSASCVLGDA